MISRSSLALRAGSCCCRALVAPRRSLASAAAAARSGPPASAASAASFQISEAGGIKIGSRDMLGPTTKLAIVAKAGTRYEPLPGLTAGLEAFAFKNTANRSSLRITREAELLGGQLHASHTREALVLSASFLRQDLPYFVELLAEVISQTKYTSHELHEDIDPVLKLRKDAYSASAVGIALDSAHAAAFHTGLGSALYPTTATPSKYVHEDVVGQFSRLAYGKGNFSLICDGASAETISRWATEFFQDLAAPAPATHHMALDAKPSAYYGGESRVSHPHGNAMVIAFPGAGQAAPKPEQAVVAVLASLLGGQSSIKWTTGSSLLARATAAAAPDATAVAVHLPYSDAGLLAIQISGATAESVRSAASAAVKALKDVAGGKPGADDVAKAVARARFDALDAAQARDAAVVLAGTGLAHAGRAYETADLAGDLESVTKEKLQKTAKALLDGKASVAAVGDLFVLPYGDELGLRV